MERLLKFVAMLTLLVACAFPPTSIAADCFAYWPGAEYETGIPSVEQVLGHKSGDRITRPHDVIRYFDALREATPDRVVVKEYARSWVGRPLIYVAISSTEEEGRNSGPRTYIIPVQVDQSGARKLASLLAAQGVEVKEAHDDFDACGKTYSKGSFVG